MRLGWVYYIGGICEVGSDCGYCYHHSYFLSFTIVLPYGLIFYPSGCAYYLLYLSGLSISGGLMVWLDVGVWFISYDIVCWAGWLVGCLVGWVGLLSIIYLHICRILVFED